MHAKIKEKREVAKGTLMVIFDLLGEEVDFRPGQYFWVTLLDPPYDDEKGPRRHISVVTSPNERGVLGLCTRLRDTAFKRSLAEMPVGADVDVEQPKGNFLLPGGHGHALRVHRRRDRDHGLSLHAPVHHRGGAASPRDARLLESRPRVDGVPRRAHAARAGTTRTFASC